MEFYHQLRYALLPHRIHLPEVPPTYLAVGYPWCRHTDRAQQMCPELHFFPVDRTITQELFLIMPQQTVPLVFYKGELLGGADALESHLTRKRRERH